MNSECSNKLAYLQSIDGSLKFKSHMRYNPYIYMFMSCVWPNKTYIFAKRANLDFKTTENVHLEVSSSSLEDIIVARKLR